jgi:predicted ferric reductase
MGLTLSMRVGRKLVHPAVVAHLHKLISLSVLVFTALHVAGLMLDSYLKISLLESLLPFTTSYRPEWTGLGTIALYLLLAVIISAMLSARLGYKIWRAVHYITFGLFFVTMLHGLMAGTDSKSMWTQVMYMVTGFIVIFLATTRFINRDVRLKGRQAF